MSDYSRHFTRVPQLTNKRDCLAWKQRLYLALGACKRANFIRVGAAPLPLSSSPSLTESALHNAWIEDDLQIASLILQTCDEPILRAHMPILDDPTVTSKSLTIYTRLLAKYGADNIQYKHALARTQITSKCKEDGDVGEWVNGVIARAEELKGMSFDLDALTQNVLLNGLPRRFDSHVESVWTTPIIPSSEDLIANILIVDSAQLSRHDDNDISNVGDPLSVASPSYSALVAQMQSLGLTQDDLYALAARSGKSPSKEHPCAKCQATDHWANKCPYRSSGQRENPPHMHSAQSKTPRSRNNRAPSPPPTEHANIALFDILEDSISQFPQEPDAAF